MRLTIAVSCAVVALAACGSNDASGPGDAPVVQVNPGFGHTWAGQALMDMGSMSTAITGGVTVTVSGDTATIEARFCPGRLNHAADAVDALGSGDGSTVEWHGTLTCPAIPVSNDCSVTVGYTDITASLSDIVGLSVSATGWATGCDVPGWMTMVFPYPI